ncbi:MAG: type III-B CRISPR-associated protein Cas10/Cmr2 [Anaerolineales bacterium]|nr:type III-B CRISPR-associated protein Cas10/Cmr2 [Anaerolineales bacterium]
MVTRWTRKIAALLHDPPGKVFILRSRPHEPHAQLAEVLQRFALKRNAEHDEKERAKIADRIAAAADRINLPKGTEAYWDQVQPYLMHPLSGVPTKIHLPVSKTLESLDKEIQEKAGQELIRPWVESLENSGEAAKILYLRLWRFLYAELAERASPKGWIRLLPADTRQPDHPLEQHLSMSAAIADALSQPAFLIFSLGPVQTFIAEARRTQDLWVGSWLLSYLTWQAIETLADSFGPDVIVFPSLRGQPLCDAWLARRYELPCRPSLKDLARPTFPNKFVALLPAAEAEQAAKEAEKKVLEKWTELANEVYQRLIEDIFPSVDGEIEQLWQQQISRQIEVYWVIFPWPGHDQKDDKHQAENVKRLYAQLLQPSQNCWDFGKIYQVLDESGQYDPNWGTVYCLLYDLADRLFAARKNLRNFTQAEESGEKCTQCGQRAALRSSEKDARAFWSEVATRLQQKERYDIKPEGQERLCAVCTTKRFIFAEVLRDQFQMAEEDGRWHQVFPPTSELVTAPYKQKLLAKLGDAKVCSILKKFLHCARPLRDTVARKSIPYLNQLAERLPDPNQRNLANSLLQLDGEYLMSDCWTVKRLQEVWEDVTEKNVQEGRKLLAQLQDTVGSQPVKYYALLLMDGDRMGQWLSGTHPELATFAETFHPVLREQLEQQEKWQQILSKKRLITPAVHAAISQALGHFALKLVPHIVEERYPGRLIYAGGDDVLALVPLEYALTVARELRAAFSGHIRFDEEGRLQVCLGEAVSGYVNWGDEVLLTMGPAATASMGIAIVHFQHPLDMALQAVRRAEKAAKEVYGRDALCIQLLKRSGEVLSVGTKWRYMLPTDKGSESLDVVALLEEIKGRLGDEERGISNRWPYIVFGEMETLSKLPKEAQKAELKRTLQRQAGEKLSRDEKRQQAEEFAERLVRWVCAIDQELENQKSQEQQGSACSDETSVDRQTQGRHKQKRPPGFVEMTQWLLACSFLVRGGEE